MTSCSLSCLGTRWEEAAWQLFCQGLLLVLRDLLLLRRPPSPGLLLSFSFDSHLPICTWGIPKPASSQTWPCFQPPPAHCLGSYWMSPGVRGPSQCCAHLPGQLVPHKCQQGLPSLLMHQGVLRGASSTGVHCLLPKAKPESLCLHAMWSPAFDDECSP